VRELRFDPLAGSWVLIAPERSARPGSDRHRRPQRPSPTPERVPSCPFCPGNEALTPPETGRKGGPAEGPGWLVRAVPNRFPILDGAVPAPVRDEDPLLRRRFSGGGHEVVILSPRHGDTLARLRPEHAAAALRLVQDRMRAQLAGGHQYVQVFVNHQPAAGASIDHPHAQLVAMDLVPALVEHEAGALSGDGCVLCRAVRTETRPGGARAVLAGEVAAWCPFWSSAPFELLVAPRDHRGRFQDAGETLDGLAAALVRLLAGLDRAAGEPPYNLVLHTAPASVEDFHWHLHVHPRLTEPGGFELGTGIVVVERAPEDAAGALREALAAPSR
jgi:UDPglucose--hexose-1-phosphate uridylyltransferase